MDGADKTSVKVGGGPSSSGGKCCGPKKEECVPKNTVGCCAPKTQDSKPANSGCCPPKKLDSKPTTTDTGSCCAPKITQDCKPANSGCCPPKTQSQDCKPRGTGCCPPTTSNNDTNNNNNTCKPSGCKPKSSNTSTTQNVVEQVSNSKCCEGGQAANVPKRPPPPPAGKTYTICKHDPTEEETTARIAPSKLNANMYYSGQALRAVTLPLGGLGTGCIALAGDGGLREWQVQGMVNHQAHVPNSFFGFRSGTDSVLLQSSENYNQTGFVPAPLITDHLVPDASIQLLQTLPSIPSLSLTAKYPLVTMNYNLPNSPNFANLQVTLNAYNPCIPLDTFNSSLPIILFQFTIKNTSATVPSKDTSILISQQNFIGWDSISKINNNSNGGYNQNVNSINSQLNSIFMTNANSAAHPNEAVAIGVIPAPNSNPRQIQYYPVWTDVQSFFNDFTANKASTNNNGVPSPAGSTFNSGLWVNFDPLPPGASANVTLYLSWMFPNFFVNWGQPYNLGLAPPSQLFLGHYYCNNFNNSMTQFITYMNNNLYKNVNIDAVSKTFVKTFYDESSLSWEILESAGGRISVPRSPTCMLLANGRFHAFEGCNGASTTGGQLGGVGGCCPMDCTHVWNYAQTLSRLWPSLERGMRLTDLVERISPYGAIPERSILPASSQKQEWSLWPDFKGDNSQTGANLVCIDGEIGTILKTYRELLIGGKTLLTSDWWQSVYPACKRVMNHVMSSYDNSNDGVIRGLQFNTYDDVISGANTFIGCYYLTALLAMREMTATMNEMALSQFYNSRFVLGSSNLVSLCWSQSFQYFVNVNFSPSYDALGSGCFIDQLIGQFWCQLLNLGYTVPRPHVIASVQSLYSHNFQVGFPKSEQGPRVFMDMRDSGLWNCRWPNTPPPPVPMLYNGECWSGVEYPVACLALGNGLTNIASKLLSAIRARQDGTRRSPWNEVECGDHYSRQQSSYILIEAASGYHWNGLLNKMTWNVLNFDQEAKNEQKQDEEIRGKVWGGFWITGDAWGKYEEWNGGVKVEVRWGELKLEEVEVGRGERLGKVFGVEVRGKKLEEAMWKSMEGKEKGFVAVKINEGEVDLKAGEEMVIVFRE